MKRKIYWNMCLMALLAVILSAVMATLVYYRNMADEMRREIVTEARYLEAGIELSGPAYLENLSGSIADTTRSRVTLVAEDGTVLYDNYAAADTMENHGSRPEIQEAMESGAGSSVRTSSTLSERTFYYALQLEDGTVIRVANTTDSVLANVLRMVPALAAVAALLVILCMILADRQTKRIVAPINELDLDHPAEVKIYDELAPLLVRFDRQRSTIKQQMETLKSKQREFTAITENMSEGFIVVGKRGEVASYNTSAMRILGVDEKQPREAGVNILSFNRSHVFRTTVDEALSGRHCEQNMEIGGRMYQIIANPVMEKDEVTGAIIVILDVTEKEEREELRREFTANVSHELKTPLTSISGYAEIMKNGLVKQEDMKRFSENIYTEAQRMIVLIGDIIKLSRLDEASTDLEKTSVDLYAAAQNVLARLQMQAKAQNVTLKLEGEAAQVSGMPQILDEMIYNLCDNGIKYNKPGGHVTVRVYKEQGAPVLSVEDDGIGIPEADQERVFERFYRVDKSHSRQIGGTGLGLSIVKHGAIYHNARVEMESHPGQGTRVRIRFPEFSGTETREIHK